MPDNEASQQNGVAPAKIDILTALKQKIFDTAGKPGVQPVSIPAFPDLDGQIYVCVFDVDAKVKVDQVCQNGDYKLATRDMLAAVCRWATCDADGDLIFADSDIPMLEKADRRFTEPIWKEAIYLNGYLRRSVDDAIKN